MKTQFSHNLLSSFYLWFESILLGDDAKAYATDQSNEFSYVSDNPQIPDGYYGYEGKFRELVAEYSVDKPNSGVFIDGVFTSGDSPDIYIDYKNGRIVVPQASGTGLTITANNTIKEINIYITEEDEEQLLVMGDFVPSDNNDSTFLYLNKGKLDEKIFQLPAVFITSNTPQNELISFGGEYDTKTRIKAIVMCYDNYTRDGILSLFADQIDTCFKQIPFEDYPYGDFYSLKSYPYSYSSFSSSYTTNNFIEGVQTSTISNPVIMNKLEKNLLVGFIDFDVSSWRYPRA